MCFASYNITLGSLLALCQDVVCLETFKETKMCYQ